VLGDPVRIRQVLGNLISNAVKFTQSGEVTGTVMRDGQDWLCFEVRDTGIGISQDRIAAIFDKFTQAESSTTRRYGGTGLGLSISRHLAELMGGSLQVESTEGSGSAFRLRIPLEVAVQDRPQEKPNPDTWKLPADFRILVVDDNPVNLRICMHFTQKTGAIVESASSGLAAIAMHRELPYDLIFMDCHMPEMDGWQATERIRAMGGRAGQVPVYALTADVFPEVHEKCWAAGMTGYLSKPIQIDELQKVLRAHAAAGARSTLG
jgi:CheY-like chemotaxis protein